jgi:hypothetical protein
MRIDKLLAGTLTLAMSATSFAAQTDSTPLSAPASAFTLVSSDVRAESDVYFLRGTGPFKTWINPQDTQLDRSLYSLSHMFGSDGSTYVPGATLKAAKPSGTVYGYNVGYDFKLARVPGSFTVETSYRSGVRRDDSGLIPFDSYFTIQIDDTPFTIRYSGDIIRTVDLHTSDLSFLTLWRPAGSLGDWLAAGFEYSHGEYDCDFVVRADITVSVTDSPGTEQKTEVHSLNDIRIDDYLLHVRLGGRPLVVFAQGKCGIKARADLAAGYSTRDDYVTETTHTVSTEAGVTSTDDSSHGQKGSLSDTLIFKGSASLSFYYKTGLNTFEAGAGFICESDFGPNRSGQTNGLMARLGYTRAW